MSQPADRVGAPSQSVPGSPFSDTLGEGREGGPLVCDEQDGNVLVYEGSLSNAAELGERLRRLGRDPGRGTEAALVLSGYAQLGSAIFEHLDGAFCLALHDTDRQTLILARDRFGQRPLYYTMQHGRCTFASDAEVVRDLSRRPAQLHAAALLEYFAFGCVAGPATIVEGVHQVPPGCYVEIAAERCVERRYYRYSYPSSERRPTDDELLDELRRAVGRRLPANAPAGVLLSGGVDSSLIATLARDATSHALPSFAFGWPTDHNELPAARAFAGRIGATLFDVPLHEATFADDVRTMVRAMDLPLADSAAFPTHQLARAAAATGIPVLLSGEGGDELFGYYTGHRGTDRVRHLMKRLLYGAGRTGRDQVLGDAWFDVTELARAFGSTTTEAVLANRVEAYLECGDSPSGRHIFDFHFTIPWMLLPKVHGMAAAHGIEIRFPLLDHRLIEQWAAIPLAAKATTTENRVRLRQLCAATGLLPDEFFTRRKLGMNLPLSWCVRSRSELFESVVTDRNSLTIEIFGRQAVAEWFAGVRGESFTGWTKNAQRIWSAFVLEWWRAERAGR